MVDTRPTRAYLAIVESDPLTFRAPDGRTLGGAGFTTMREARERFARIPEVPQPADDEWGYLLDLHDRRYDILDSKYIARETALELIGEPDLHALRVAAEARMAAEAAAHRAVYRPSFIEGTTEYQRA